MQRTKMKTNFRNKLALKFYRRG